MQQNHQQYVLADKLARENKPIPFIVKQNKSFGNGQLAAATVAIQEDSLRVKFTSAHMRDMQQCFKQQSNLHLPPIELPAEWLWQGCPLQCQHRAQFVMQEASGVHIYPLQVKASLLQRQYYRVGFV